MPTQVYIGFATDIERFYFYMKILDKPNVTDPGKQVQMTQFSIISWLATAKWTVATEHFLIATS